MNSPKITPESRARLEKMGFGSMFSRGAPPAERSGPAANTASPMVPIQLPEQRLGRGRRFWLRAWLLEQDLSDELKRGVSIFAQMLHALITAVFLTGLPIVIVAGSLQAVLSERAARSFDIKYLEPLFVILSLVVFLIFLSRSFPKEVLDENVLLVNWPTRTRSSIMARQAAKEAIIQSDLASSQMSAEEAATFHRKAAHQGSDVSQFFVGLSYEEGDGVPQNYETAMRWYRKAAEQGFSGAQFNLGVLFKKGLGGPQDPEQARYWFKLAAEQGHHEAIEALSERPTS